MSSPKMVSGLPEAVSPFGRRVRARKSVGELELASSDAISWQRIAGRTRTEVD